ncbi:MAG: hypothetical protein ONB48_07095 [candidate division KSB1 bacterium]|nr:hypothetical protein [candidate division KSB1 bacterium]MDZ7273308.1 hypothetical protein [candidate division KSB1 bacterium]MDZ7285410.1 hypothetical protein [candidate division KSB1 bacterium]MDZ7298442.1 hypothetical protein [candidate division KSB1 bacterium]MDZ7308527.1 hypothetical protein [candidate division KSB1 bacterium]
MKAFCLLLTSALLTPVMAQPQLSDCKRLFENADACRAVRLVDSTWVAEAWDGGYAPGEEKFLGLVLQRTIPFEGIHLSLYVGVDASGTITKVVVSETPAVEEEFLRQFSGRSRNDSLWLAQRTEDLLFVPAPIKAMRGREQLSAAILRHLQTALQAVSPPFR